MDVALCDWHYDTGVSFSGKQVSSANIRLAQAVPLTPSHIPQTVAEFGLLGLEVGEIVLVGRHLERELFHDLNAVYFEAADLLGVVGEDAQPPQAQVAEDVGADAVVAAVDRQSEFFVGFDGIEPFVLQLVRPQLIVQPDTASLLTKIDQCPLARLLYHLQGRVKLLPAVASEGIEDVAGHAF